MKNKNILIIVGIILLIVIGIIAFKTITGNSVKQDTIKIGYIGPLTGDAAILGIEASQAIQLAVNQVNSQGGVNGKQVELIIEDDSYDTAKSVAAYNKLVNQDGVKTIIMSTYGGVFAVSDRAKSDGVLILDSLDCDDNIAKLSDNVFCLAKETKDLANIIADYAVEKGYKNIGIIHSTNDAFMPSVAQIFKERVGNNASVQIESYTVGTTDFKSSLAKLKDKDAIVFLGYSEIGIAIKQARDFGFNKTILSISSVATDPTIQKASHDTMEGMYFSFYMPANGNKLASKFASDYNDSYGRKPIVYVASDQAYDSANVLLKEVLVKTDDNDINGKIKAMHNIHGFSGVTGNLTMSPDGRMNGIKIRLFQLKNMTPVYVEG
jgi:branched-chain amino acid transport system substrate-binding protein